MKLCRRLVVLSAKSRINFLGMHGGAVIQAFLALAVVINPYLTPIESVLIAFSVDRTAMVGVSCQGQRQIWRDHQWATSWKSGKNRPVQEKSRPFDCFCSKPLVVFCFWLYVWLSATMIDEREQREQQDQGQGQEQQSNKFNCVLRGRNANVVSSCVSLSC